MDICKQQDPPLERVAGDDAHYAACHLDEDTKDREAAKLLAGTVAEAAS
jgi:hypothetical protein